MRIVFATTNRGKFRDAERILRPCGVELEMREAHFEEPRSLDTERIASEKAEFAGKLFSCPVIADDSGFFVPSLGGFPATHVNFALKTLGIGGILKLLEGRKGKDRACEFRNSVAYFDPGNPESGSPGMAKPRVFTTACRGTVAGKAWHRLPEHHWSELALIFVPKGFDRPLADEKVNSAFHEWWAENNHYKALGEWLKSSVLKGRGANE